MRRALCLCCVALLAACAKKNDEANAPADSAAMAPAPAPAEPAPITLNDVAGTWKFTGKREGSDSVLVTYDIIATADTANWQLKFPNRAKTETMHVLNVAGDSIVVHAGPYESVLRKGVMVTTHTVLRMRDGKLVGQTVARYSVNTPDSVVIINAEGVR